MDPTLHPSTLKTFMTDCHEAAKSPILISSDDNASDECRTHLKHLQKLMRMIVPISILSYLFRMIAMSRPTSPSLRKPLSLLQHQQPLSSSLALQV